MSTNELAIDRGRPEVAMKYRDRWRRVTFSDLVRIAHYAWRDVNTLAKGEGPIAEFERNFAALCHTKYALAMNSGTAALHSAYFAVGVKPGTEVIVPLRSFRNLTPTATTRAAFEPWRLPFLWARTLAGTCAPRVTGEPTCAA